MSDDLSPERLTRRAPARINSFDPETGTFTAIVATETPVPRKDFFDGPFEEVLSMKPGAVRLARFNSGRASLLDSHDSRSVRGQIGVITAVRLEPVGLVVDVQLSDRADVKPIAAEIAAGRIRNVSIGYLGYASAESKGPDGSRVVTRTDWEPVEVSLVSVPADPNSYIRSMNMNGENQASQHHGPVATDRTNEARPGGALAGTRSETAQRQITVQQEQQLLASADAFGVERSQAADCIARGLTLEQARDHLQEIAVARQAPRNIPHHRAGLHFGDDFSAPDGIARAIEGALHARMSGKAPEGRSREFMGRSVLDMGVALLEARGERVSWSSRDRLAEQIMTRGAGLHTTSDFPLLLQSAGNRVLLEAYEAAQSPLLPLARRRDATDFRPLSLIKLGEAPRLKEVTEGGEVKHGTRAEAKEGFRVKTFGRIFGLSRQAIINDDLAAFADVNTAWGRAAAETEAAELVALFTANSGNGINLDDENPIYTTVRGNKAATGTVIDVASLGLARQAMREIKGLDGETPISVTPKHLVVGAAKETEAEQVLANLAAAQVSETNPFSGKLTLHVEPRLTGNAWRLFADPAELATIAIAYLNGQEGPQLSVREGWDVLGTEFRCVLDFGCGITEWRGTYMNPGN